MRDVEQKQVHKLIGGALLSAIDAHGPITRENCGSAIKRVAHQMRSFQFQSLITEQQKIRDCEQDGHLWSRWKQYRREVPPKLASRVSRSGRYIEARQRRNCFVCRVVQDVPEESGGHKIVSDERHRYEPNASHPDD